MPSTLDWNKEAEEKHRAEREDIRHAGKIGFAFYILLLVALAVVFGVIHLAEWMFNGGNLIPNGRDVVWVAGSIALVFAGGYFSERYEEAKSIREQRLIRLEMKIDTLLEKCDRIDSRIADLREEVRETYSQ